MPLLSFVFAGPTAGPFAGASSLRRLGRAVVLLALTCGLVFGGSGCKDRIGTPLEQTRSATAVGATPPPHPGTPVDGPAAGPEDPSLAPVDKLGCPVNRLVKETTAGTAEAVLSGVYAAALQPDTPEAFNAFAIHFGKEHQRSWIKSQYWPRIRKHVGKYLTETDPPAFRICREERKSDGSIKFFIRSHDEAKSNPPITLRQDDGRWVIEFFTP